MLTCAATSSSHVVIWYGGFYEDLILSGGTYMVLYNNEVCQRKINTRNYVQLDPI